MPIGDLIAASSPWYATVGCKDWLQRDAGELSNQWSASFKFIPFAVETDQKGGGRRIHVHEYPLREWWDNEDMGRLRQQFDVTAYVFGDEVDLWAEKLFAACVDGQPGLLYLPLRVPVQARCMSVESTFQANALGRIDFTLRFSLESGKPAGIAPSEKKTANQVANQATVSSNNLIAESRSNFEEDFTGQQAQVGRKEAAKTMRRAGQLLRNASANARVAARESAKVEFAVKKIMAMAEDLSDSQRTEANSITQEKAVRSQRLSKLPASVTGERAKSALRTSTQQVTRGQGFSHEGFGGTFQHALFFLMRGASNPGDLGQSLGPLSRLKPHDLTASSSTTASTSSVKDELHLAETVAAFCRRQALANIVSASLRIAPGKQPDAIIARTRFIIQIDDEAALAADHPGTFRALRSLRSSVGEFVAYHSQGGAGTFRAINLPFHPLAVIVATIYKKGDSSRRDREMMLLNGVRHPLFPPGDLYAVKPQL